MAQASHNDRRYTADCHQKRAQAYWSASVVSTVHAVVITSVSIKTLVGGPGMSVQFSDIYTVCPDVLTWGPFFMGYLVCDLLLTFKHWNHWGGGGANVMHHIFALIAWWQIMEGGYSHIHAASAWLLEMTTPFVNQRWFFAKAGVDGAVYTANGVMLILLWLLLRILFMGWAFTTKSTLQILELESWRAVSMTTLFGGGYLLQWFWGYKLLRGMLKALGFISGKGKKQ